VAGTNAFVWVLLGACIVGIVAVVARARVEIARIQARVDREVKRR
jgi:hypothetical protein